MRLRQDILSALQNTFLIDFHVNQIERNKYQVVFKDSNKDLFRTEIYVRDNTRLIITLEPEKYGLNFVHAVAQSSMNKREVFCTLWNKIGSSNLSIKVNEKSISQEEFINDKTVWNKFELRFSKAPFVEEDSSSKINTVICDYVCSIFSMVLSLVDYSIMGQTEGNKKTVQITKYERNPINRQICLQAKGYACSVCGVKMGEVYGEIGEKFIEVHHSLPVSEMGDDHVVDPIRELFPLCPNCHAIIHRKNPPLTIEELRNIYNEQNN